MGTSLPKDQSNSNSPNINYDLNTRNGHMRYRNTAMAETAGKPDHSYSLSNFLM